MDAPKLVLIEALKDKVEVRYKVVEEFLDGNFIRRKIYSHFGPNPTHTFHDALSFPVTRTSTPTPTEEVLNDEL